MKIGVNARFLLKPFTGIGQYTQNLLLELTKLDQKNDYIFVIPELAPKKMRDKFGKNVSFKFLHEKAKGSAGVKKTWWEQVSLPDFFIKENIDMALYPYPSNPWFKSFYKKGIKTIVTVHDCIPWINKSYSKKMLSRLYNFKAKKAIKLADTILTVSKVSKRDIQKYAKVEAAKIKVIHNDAGDVFKTENINEGVLSHFNIKKGKYFLYVGGYDERKNVEELLLEYGAFAKDSGDVYPLVMVGGKQVNNYLYASLDGNDPENGKIIRTGFLDGESLAALYADCTAYINLSKYEGFNIPVVEAANMGAPLILSDIDTHRELFNGHALFVDISKRGAAKNAMNKLLDKNIQEKYMKKSQDLSKEFSWSLSAQKLKDVIFSR